MTGAWRFRLARAVGRTVTHVTAALTLYRMPPFVSASAVVVQDDWILTVLDPIRGEPTLPGGHLTWRERISDAVMREVREETGYIVEPGALVGVYSGEECTGEPGIVRVVYSATVVGGALRSSSEGEARWRPLAEMAGAETRDSPIVRRWMERRTASP